MSIGDGLYTRLGPSTSTATWIGYQIVSGCGNGLGTTIVSIHFLMYNYCLTKLSSP
jgi:hypothetical protein